MAIKGLRYSISYENMHTDLLWVFFFLVLFSIPVDSCIVYIYIPLFFRVASLALGH